MTWIQKLSLAFPWLFALFRKIGLDFEARDRSRYRVLPDSTCVEFKTIRGEWVPLAWRPTYGDALLILNLIVSRFDDNQRPTPRTFDRWYEEYQANWYRAMSHPGAQEAAEKLMSSIADFLTPPGGTPPTNEELLRGIKRVEEENAIERARAAAESKSQ